MTEPPDGLPETFAPKDPVRWWLIVLTALLGTLVLALLLVNAWRGWGLPQGEGSNGSGVENIVISAEESPYLPADAARFGHRPGTVYVYVVVRRMPSGERLRVRVERESADSVIGRIFPTDRGGFAIQPLESRPGPGEDLDVIRFALGARSGETLPPGRYTVSVYRESREKGSGPAARKFFQIRG